MVAFGGTVGALKSSNPLIRTGRVTTLTKSVIIRRERQMATTSRHTYSIAEAAHLIAAEEGFVERALGEGLVPSSSPGRIDADGLQALRALYVESGQALADLAQSAIDEGWYDISIERLRELGIVDADDCDDQGE
jgi:hypothetical protein